MSTLLPALAISLGAYLLGTFVNRAAGHSPFLHPVVLAMFLAVAVLSGLRAAGFAFEEDYFRHNNVLIEGLMIAITAFALPLIDNGRKLVRDLPGILATSLLASFLLGVVTLAVCFLIGLDGAETASLSLRTVTNPMAAVIAEANGLSVEMAMLGVFITGTVGVVFSEKIAAFIGVTDERRVGLMLGITCHTFGVVRALERSPLSAAYATMGMILTGLIYAFAVPTALALI